VYASVASLSEPFIRLGEYVLHLWRNRLKRIRGGPTGQPSTNVWPHPRSVTKVWSRGYMSASSISTSTAVSLADVETVETAIKEAKERENIKVDSFAEGRKDGLRYEDRYMR
jgi:hypothetical protein